MGVSHAFFHQWHVVDCIRGRDSLPACCLPDYTFNPVRSPPRASQQPAGRSYAEIKLLPGQRALNVAVHVCLRADIQAAGFSRRTQAKRGRDACTPARPSRPDCAPPASVFLTVPGNVSSAYVTQCLLFLLPLVLSCERITAQVYWENMTVDGVP